MKAGGMSSQPRFDSWPVLPRSYRVSWLPAPSTKPGSADRLKLSRPPTALLAASTGSSGVLVSKTSSTVFPNQFRPVAKIVLPLLVIFVYWPAPTPVAANSSAIGSARPETNTPWLLSNRPEGRGGGKGGGSPCKSGGG